MLMRYGLYPALARAAGLATHSGTRYESCGCVLFVPAVVGMVLNNSIHNFTLSATVTPAGGGSPDGFWASAITSLSTTLGSSVPNTQYRGLAPVVLLPD